MTKLNNKNKNDAFKKSLLWHSNVLFCLYDKSALVSQHCKFNCSSRLLPFVRIIRVYRGKKHFGFTLRGHAPVCVDSVIPGTASGLKQIEARSWEMPSLCVAWPKHCSVLAGEGGGVDAFLRGRVCCGASHSGLKVIRRCFVCVSVPGSGFVWLTNKCWEENTQSRLYCTLTDIYIVSTAQLHSGSLHRLLFEGEHTEFNWLHHFFDSCSFLCSLQSNHDSNQIVMIHYFLQNWWVKKQMQVQASNKWNEIN